MGVEKQVRGIALPYLRAWRQRKGLSQRELGELAGVQYSQISRIERQGQHVTPLTIKRLAAALGISREALIADDPARQ
jgi:transcriptional regulator with XRE-family HTH domain